MLFFVTYSSQRHNLNSIKDKTVGNGQHGTARWATQQEIKRIYHHVPFTPELWRQAAREGKQPTANGKSLPQGIVLGSKGNRTTTALVDSDDIHVMMIGASGVGKTAYFLYPNLEYAWRQRDELSCPGYQGRPGPELRCYCQGYLWIPDICGGSS